MGTTTVHTYYTGNNQCRMDITVKVDILNQVHNFVYSRIFREHQIFVTLRSE